ncbi:MAG: class I SAM-dependent methyltransferase [Candidatus Thorarchaeota archaeon]
MSNKMNEESWNRLSVFYQEFTRISLNNFHYNPYGPGDKELGIIGDVKGLDVLDVGCGCGQNSIVLSKWGAKSVTAIDQSESQLDYAKRLAKREKQDIRILKCDMEDMSILPDDSFDLVVSSHAMNYASNIEKVFMECSRVLRYGGRIIICMAHPIWIVLGEALEKGNLNSIANYFDTKRERWDWERRSGEKIATFESTPWRLSQIVNALCNARFIIKRLEEPRGYSKEEMRKIPADAIPYADAMWRNEEFIKANQIVPYSLIVAAVKQKEAY